MTETEILEEIKNALGMTGNKYMDAQFKMPMQETIEYLKEAGVSETVIFSKNSVGVIVRGACDLWNNGAPGGKHSEYFMQRAIQLKYKKENAEK